MWRCAERNDADGNGIDRYGSEAEILVTSIHEWENIRLARVDTLWICIALRSYAWD